MSLCADLIDGFAGDGSDVGHSHDLPQVVAFGSREDQSALML